MFKLILLKRGEVVSFSAKSIKPEYSTDSNSSVNVVDLLKRVKFEEKRKKRQNMLLAVTTVSTIAIIGFIVTF
tara:strand:- start:209 stop:427 length:219 start_codon:yes stop_codon:yes gene_type:complete